MVENNFNQALIRLFQRHELYAFCKPGETLDDPTLVGAEYREEFLRLNPTAEDVTEKALSKLLQ